MPPSRGCKPCRDSKVKCDETRPYCNRCTRLGLSCEGYRTADELIFRDQNAAAESASARAISRRPRPEPIVLSVSQESESTDPRQQITVLAPDMNNPQPWLRQRVLNAPQLSSMESTAVSLFFSNFVVGPCNHGLTYGYLNDLPQLFQQCSPGSLLDSAVRACSLAFYGLATRDRSIMFRAATLHGETLGKLRHAFTQEESSKQDSTLLTILILDFYELIAGDLSRPLGTHTQGLAAVVAQRGLTQIDNPIGWNLFRVAHRRIQTLQLITRMGPLPDSSQLLQALNPELPEVHLASITVDVNAVLHRAKDCFENTPWEAARVEMLIAEMRDLDERLQLWRLSLPRQWQFLEVHPDGEQASRSCTTVMHQYHDIWIADTWNYGRLCRILLLETIIQCYRGLGRFDPNVALPGVMQHGNVMSPSSAVQILVDDVLASAPFLTGTSDLAMRQGHPQPVHTFLGMYLLQPALTVIEAASSTTGQQTERAKGTSRLIATRLGGQSRSGQGS